MIIPIILMAKFVKSWTFLLNMLRFVSISQGLLGFFVDRSAENDSLGYTYTVLCFSWWQVWNLKHSLMKVWLFYSRLTSLSLPQSCNSLPISQCLSSNDQNFYFRLVIFKNLYLYTVNLILKLSLAYSSYHSSYFLRQATLYSFWKISWSSFPVIFTKIAIFLSSSPLFMCAFWLKKTIAVQYSFYFVVNLLCKNYTGLLLSSISDIMFLFYKCLFKVTLRLRLLKLKPSLTLTT